MNCLVIDDNPKTSQKLIRLLEAIPGVGKVHTVVEPYMVRSVLRNNEIDVVFVRVRLWDFSQWEQLKRKPAIVFLSGGKDKLTGRPGTSVQFSLREPYLAVDILQLLKSIRETTLLEKTDFFFLRYSGRFHKTCFADIEMIERKDKRYLKFWLSYGDALIPGSLTAWLRKLPEGKFIRVSDTLILPVEEVRKIKTDEYTFKDRRIKLTFRFALAARREMNHCPDGL